MDRESALEIVKRQLTDHRYHHTIGVMETALVLAERYGANVKKAELAAIFHDYAKFRPKEEMQQIILDEGMPQELLLYNSELWHAPVGAFLVQKEVGIDDVEILDAIRYHTSGRKNMSILEKVIYLADYIEPGRHFPGVDEVREMAKLSLDRALIKSIQNTIFFLMKRGQPVFPATFNTYNDLIMRSGRID
ncbi:bis(5'-nucleosyl)-tetraphosphatase (symmetrical) YqeK [Bacillus sp. DTU_2020_1000418_1_SI_GHA_SEK_038]|uniref:bis(5'-nucleosyl)-tetraphosphatase (symmetrical) YqeK n=1 Tax=Bacillus sp. DTU_2020_1000418_1_SI_GHA_SEK_038 TaxID=3077585 RepID=UPI0028F05846|nr:bis(5'-nucleosyl)-tetraphosphatase (symmetrical) YqeK [Bacillus sp. DTU_2020_1000418_1_SI_GHA_SEK_038]WNS74369.1 bis(5'-nucleosyl)-tetraphosphatase (symmetrical) YqeK [Bacillus sp. DTU_2020_1000418_1_SI_GHA_SEK_038]